MKKFILASIFLFIIAVAPNLHGQWAKLYGGSEDDWANSVQQTSDGMGGCKMKRLIPSRRQATADSSLLAIRILTDQEIRTSGFSSSTQKEMSSGSTPSEGLEMTGPILSNRQVMGDTSLEAAQIPLGLGQPTYG